MHTPEMAQTPSGAQAARRRRQLSAPGGRGSSAPRGVTLVEMIAVFVVLGVLGGFGVMSYSALTAKSDRATDFATLSAASSNARSKAAVNYNRFPDDLAAVMTLSGLTVSDAASENRTSLSVAVSPDNTTSYITLKSGNDCIGVSDNIATGSTAYVVDGDVTAGSCTGANLALTTIPVGESSEVSPVAVTIGV